MCSIIIPTNLQLVLLHYILAGMPNIKHKNWNIKTLTAMLSYSEQGKWLDAKTDWFIMYNFCSMKNVKDQTKEKTAGRTPVVT